MKLQAVAGWEHYETVYGAIGEDVMVCAKIDDFILPC